MLIRSWRRPSLLAVNTENCTTGSARRAGMAFDTMQRQMNHKAVGEANKIPKTVGNTPYSAKRRLNQTSAVNRKGNVNMEMKIKHRLFGVLMVGTLVVGITGCSKDPYRSSGRVLDDRMTTGRVRSALNHSPVYKFPEVDVKTYN